MTGFAQSAHESGTKRCSRCSRWLPLSEFAARVASSDGRQNYCRTCSADWARENRPRKRAAKPVVEVGLKWCSRCDRAKPVEDFALHSKMRDGRQSYCRDCFADIYRERRTAAGLVSRPRVVPEGEKFCRACAQIKPMSEFGGRTGRSSQRTFRCQDCMRARDRERHLASAYGMTVGAVEQLLASQGGQCAICQVAPAIHVDHDHATGAVRGMLCFRCNAALGQFADDPATLLRAARYLMTAAGWDSRVEPYFTERLAEVDVRHAS